MVEEVFPPATVLEAKVMELDVEPT